MLRGRHLKENVGNYVSINAVEISYFTKFNLLNDVASCLDSKYRI
jgi:hypothetical protein